MNILTYFHCHLIHTNINMALNFFKSERGKDKVAFDGQSFVRDKTTGITRYWHCDQKSITGCTARLITKDENLHKVSGGDHNHAADPGKIVIAVQMGELKRRAVALEPTANIVNTCLAVGVPAQYHGRLPQQTSNAKKAQRVRQKHLPPAATSPDTIDLDGVFGRTLSGENWVIMHPSSPDSEGILVLSSPSNIRLLSGRTTWFADGTFDVCPAMFDQVSS